MTKLVFIRHAETDLAGRFCGHSDPPVNARGYQQIRTLVEELSARSFDAIWSSDLQRAVTTAEGLAGVFGLAPMLSPALREISFGEWDGLGWEEIEQRDFDFAQRWMAEYPHLPAPSGERFEDFEKRVLEEVSRLVLLPGRVAVVSHAGVMRVVLRRLCGADEERAWVRTKPYCCFFEYDSENVS